MKQGACAPTEEVSLWALSHFSDADLGDRRRSKDSFNWHPSWPQPLKVPSPSSAATGRT